MKKQVEKILSKPTITYEAGDGSWRQESSLTLRQIEEVTSEICQLYEPLIQQTKEEMRLFMIEQHEIECALCKVSQKEDKDNDS